MYLHSPYIFLREKNQGFCCWYFLGHTHTSALSSWIFWMKSAISIAPLTWRTNIWLWVFFFISLFRKIWPAVWWWRPCSGSPARCSCSHCSGSPGPWSESKEVPETKIVFEHQLGKQTFGIIYQHVKNEELLTPWSCWVDLVASHLPDCVLNVLVRKSKSGKLWVCQIWCESYQQQRFSAT